jgi:hypothetical protein
VALRHRLVRGLSGGIRRGIAGRASK